MVDIKEQSTIMVASVAEGQTSAYAVEATLRENKFSDLGARKRSDGQNHSCSRKISIDSYLCCITSTEKAETAQSSS